MDRLREALGGDADADASGGEEAAAGGGNREQPPGGVALFVDGPNVLRDEFDVDLDDVRDRAGEAGPLAVTRLYVDEHATPSLMQAAEARGYDVRVTSGDVDVKLAVDATELVLSEAVDVLAVASRDTDFKPVLEKANRAGVRTLAIAPGEHGRSDALMNAATDSVVMDDEN
jgi:uncharacterized protein (TIGR00288 family)